MELAGFLPEAAGKVRVLVDQKAMERERVVISYKSRKQALVLGLDAVDVRQRIEIVLPAELQVKGNGVKERVFEFLNQAEIEFELKDAVYALVMREKRIPVVLGQLEAMGIDRELYQALTELLTGM